MTRPFGNCEFGFCSDVNEIDLSFCVSLGGIRYTRRSAGTWANVSPMEDTRACRLLL